MNIHAKISGNEKRSRSPDDRPATVNTPLGEAYAAYWNWWLRSFARQAELRFPEVFSGRQDVGGALQDPMVQIDLLYRKRGCAAVFSLSRALGRPSGFDVISHVLTSSRTVPELIRRWSGFLSLQASLRYPETRQNGIFVASEKARTLILSPYTVRPANLKPFGPAMLAGVATGTLESAGLAIHGIWSVPRAGPARPLYRFGSFVGDAMDFGSDIVIILADDMDQMQGLTPPSSCLGFSHLLGPQAGRAHVKLLARVVAVLEANDGEHSALPTTAARLGLSPRSLSRRMTEAGLGYGRLARYVRLRKASRLLVAGGTSLDDIAFEAAYSDRHHLSRDFRQMAQVKPSGLRDLLAG